MGIWYIMLIICVSQPSFNSIYWKLAAPKKNCDCKWLKRTNIKKIRILKRGNTRFVVNPAQICHKAVETQLAIFFSVSKQPLQFNFLLFVYFSANDVFCAVADLFYQFLYLYELSNVNRTNREQTSSLPSKTFCFVFTYVD